MANETLDGAAIREIAALAHKSACELLHPKLDKPIPGLPDQIPILVNKQTGAMSGVKTLFEAHRIHPERKSGTAEAYTLESFIDLVERHKTDDSVIFADTDWTAPSMTAVIDYHQNKEAASPISASTASTTSSRCPTSGRHGYRWTASR